MSRQPKRASVTSPPRPKMTGTVLPQDSMRGIRAPWNTAPVSASAGATTALLRGPSLASSPPTVMPPPPPSVASSAASSIAYQNNLKLLAAAGRDLFRQGLAFDGVRPTHPEPRHPAVTPNLLSIPEDDSVVAADVAAPSELIVIVGGPLNGRGEPGVWLSNRIAKAIQLYWQTMLSFAHEDEDEEEDEATRPKALCFLVPTGSEASDEGVVETEAIRKALVGTGISPHHILMDCTATSLVDNALQLVGILRHRRVHKVHVVTSTSQVARVRLCFDEILHAALGADLAGVQLLFHGAPDGLKATERAARYADEQARMGTTRVEIDQALQRLRTKKTSQRRPTPHAYSNYHTSGV